MTTPTAEKMAEQTAFERARQRYAADAYEDRATVTLYNFSRGKMDDACHLADAMPGVLKQLAEQAERIDTLEADAKRMRERVETLESYLATATSFYVNGFGVRRDYAQTMGGEKVVWKLSDYWGGPVGRSESTVQSAIKSAEALAKAEKAAREALAKAPLAGGEAA